MTDRSPPDPLTDVPEHACVRIEVTRGGLIKWGADGGVDFISPVPCPFNYGSVVGTTGADGDPADALVLGPRLARGSEAEWPVVGCVRFLDMGQPDDKWICGSPLTAWDEMRLRWFFGLYALAKRTAYFFLGRSGSTRFMGVERLHEEG